ncbi:AMP-binding protein [uncultured Shimia sp.]|uniref:AMP-binding protein n=1 Tax=uncultured Shimia sp. TaxID=573152 RepID=UPI0026029F12|nr:AMP-binding protein [uncultured Shimia sp.]
MTTALDSMRAFRDIVRAFSHGVAVIGPDMPIADYWSKIIQHGVTELFLTPLMLHRLLNCDHRPADTSNIKRIFVASGTAQNSLLQEAHQVFGPVIELAAGTPETSIFAFKKYDPANHQQGDIGPAVGGITVRIQDENDCDLPANAVGRLRLTVPQDQRFEGYLGGASAYDAYGGVYPGFLASLSPDGQMTKHGRTDDRLSLGGTRYFSGLIETALEKLPTVERVCALRVFASDGSEALGLAIKPATGFKATDIQKLAKRSLPGIGDVIVRVCASFPVGKEGLPDREALEQWWQRKNEL